MQVKQFQLFLISSLIYVNIFAQTTPDLILQDEITPDYISYLVTQELTWLTQINLGGDDEATMKAHMGMAILAFAWSHVNGDTLITEMNPVVKEIGRNLDSIGTRIFNDIIPILELLPDQDDFFNDLVDFFDSGDYEDFRDSLNTYVEQLENEFDEAGLIIDEFFEDLDDNFSEEHFANQLDAIFDGTADFNFALQVLGSDYDDTLFVFSRTFFNRLDSIAVLGDEMGNHFDDGESWMDSVMSITGGDVMPGIASFRIGFDYLTEILDSVKMVLTNQPFAPFEINVAPLDSIQDAIAEIDTLLGGKEYEFGPEEEGKTIKPLAIIQNIPGDGLLNSYEEFYRLSDPAAYTFNGIFPFGLDSLTLDLISADAIVNDWDDFDTFDTRLMALKTVWENDVLTDPFDPDAHLGIAMVLSFEMVRDHVDVYADAFRLVDEGRIDSLTFYYDWESFDLSDEIQEIDDHAAYYVDSEDPTNFVLLIKTEADGFGDYEISTGSDFDFMHITVPQVFLFREQLYLISDGLGLIADGIMALYEELDEIFILDLDPNILDFSGVDSDSALILLLEQSNPDFLTVTPYGVDQFHQTGDQIEGGLYDMGTFFDHMTDLANAMAPYEDDFDMDGTQFIEDMENAADNTWEFWEDFAYPDSVTIVDGERVNFSAWFDNPPVSFLIMWKNYVFGIDSTLGGLFPDRPVLDVTDFDWPVLPRRFASYPAYPNPFNPVTTISYDIPKPAHVTLEVYNLLGERLTTLVNDYRESGKYTIHWDASEVASGVYFYRIFYRSTVNTHKMILLK